MPTKITATCKLFFKNLNNELCEIEPLNIQLTKTYLGYAEVIISVENGQQDTIETIYNNQNQELTLLNQNSKNPIGYKINKNCLIKKNDTTLWVDFPLKNFCEIEQIAMLKNNF